VGEIDDGTLRPGRLQLQGSMWPPAVVVTDILSKNVAGAENAVRAGQAARSYSWRMPPRRSQRWMCRCVIVAGSVIGSGSGRSGRALDSPQRGRWVLGSPQNGFVDGALDRA